MKTNTATYAELLAQHLPTMPADDKENERLIAILEPMLEGDRTLTAAELKFVKLVSTLITAYEAHAYPSPAVNSLDILLDLVEARKLRQVDFVVEFGSRAYVSQIFNGVRTITPKVAEKLAKVLNVPASLLLSGSTQQTPSNAENLRAIQKQRKPQEMRVIFSRTSKAALSKADLKSPSPAKKPV